MTMARGIMQTITMRGAPKTTQIGPSGGVGLSPCASMGSLAYQFSLTAFWGFLTGKYSREWAEAIATVYERADYNASAWNILWFKSTYSLEDVEKVMNCYGNMAAAGSIPEYIDRDADGAQTKNKKLIWAAVAKCSGQAEGFVRLVMYEWYWATEDRSIRNGCFIRPATCNRYEQDRTSAPPDGEGWASMATNLALLAGVGILAYLIITRR